ncbi:MAG: hypothetical protein NZM29_03580, partial [Nitrospira sp.]|nr:hypothetical protein [Nitrospira sp.]
MVNPLGYSKSPAFYGGDASGQTPCAELAMLKYGTSDNDVRSCDGFQAEPRYEMKANRSPRQGMESTGLWTSWDLKSRVCCGGPPWEASATHQQLSHT